MKKMRLSALLAGVLVVGIGSFAAADVINIDVEAGVPSDTNHSGADGPLSSPGGAFWNFVIGGLDASDLYTEFAGPTPFDIVYLTADGNASYSDPGINNLQDSGSYNAFQILDLLPGQTYTVAAYVGHNGGFLVQDANGSQAYFYGDPGADGWSLPGSQGNGGDYFLVSGLMPYDTGNGEYGLWFSLDGTITGLQISGPIPEPSSLILLLLGGLALLRRTRG
ncbi:MAG: PEP-CTERM sorting domain-containing protein [Phycisphaerales bacterium]|nr:MAG: PEP-CTERM sorting domain-containing protein [Phycisphaerales bacterium]